MNDDGCTHISLFADEFEDVFSDYNSSLVLCDRNDVDENNNIEAQSLTIKFEFL